MVYDCYTQIKPSCFFVTASHTPRQIPGFRTSSSLFFSRAFAFFWDLPDGVAIVILGIDDALGIVIITSVKKYLIIVNG